MNHLNIFSLWTLRWLEEQDWYVLSCFARCLRKCSIDWATQLVTRDWSNSLWLNNEHAFVVVALLYNETHTYIISCHAHSQVHKKRGNVCLVYSFLLFALNCQQKKYSPKKETHKKTRLCVGTRFVEIIKKEKKWAHTRTERWKEEE